MTASVFDTFIPMCRITDLVSVIYCMSTGNAYPSHCECLRLYTAGVHPRDRNILMLYSPYFLVLKVRQDGRVVQGV
jgi:hypothetical protein